jgi:hypothetical protein
MSGKSKSTTADSQVVAKVDHVLDILGQLEHLLG